MFSHNDRMSEVGIVKVLLITRTFGLHEALNPLKAAMSHNPMPEEYPLPLGPRDVLICLGCHIEEKVVDAYVVKSDQRLALFGIHQGKWKFIAGVDQEAQSWAIADIESSLVLGDNQFPLIAFDEVSLWTKQTDLGIGHAVRQRLDRAGPVKLVSNCPPDGSCSMDLDVQASDDLAGIHRVNLTNKVQFGAGHQDGCTGVNDNGGHQFIGHPPEDIGF
jgi:hypothetical protein